MELNSECETWAAALPAYGILDPSEALPPYCSTINFQGRLLRKKELDRPGRPARRSRWDFVHAEIRGTRLVLDVIPQRQRGPERGFTSTLSHSYTLQLADAGLAVDYKERLNAFRLRVEGEQLLFLAPAADTAVTWVEHILAAVAISDSLDERSMMRYPCKPPRRPKMSDECDDRISGRWLWTKWSGQARQQREWLQQEADGRQGEGCDQPSKMGQTSRRRRQPQQEALSPSRLDESGPIVSLPSPVFGTSESVVAQAQCSCSACHAQKPATVPQYCHSSDELQAVSGIRQGTLRSEFDDPQRWTRILTMSSAWKDKCYVRDGQKIRIAQRGSRSVRAD